MQVDTRHEEGGPETWQEKVIETTWIGYRKKENQIKNKRPSNGQYHKKKKGKEDQTKQQIHEKQQRADNSPGPEERGERLVRGKVENVGDSQDGENGDGREE